MQMKTQATPYPELNGVLAELVTRVRAVLGTTFTGAYLQGSFAVGDFDAHSDVDFIVVIREELSGEQVAALQELHPQIYRLPSPWAQHLEGSYFPMALLRDYTQSGSPIWYLDHGSQALIRDGHDNTLVVRQTLRLHGVTLDGPAPHTLINPVPVEALRRATYAMMHGWGNEVLADPEQINNHFYQAFVVLNYSRLLHDLHSGTPGSKRAGAAWAQARYPQWAGLIERAWSGRPDPAASVRRPADPEELRRTLEFLRFVLEESRGLFPGEYKSV